MKTFFIFENSTIEKFFSSYVGEKIISFEKTKNPEKEMKNETVFPDKVMKPSTTAFNGLFCRFWDSVAVFTHKNNKRLKNGRKRHFRGRTQFETF